MIYSVEKYAKPGYCTGLVQISTGRVTSHHDKVDIGLIPVHKLFKLDWTRLSRT
jgi:hypothetical protein